jgi:hypothetical protein
MTLRPTARLAACVALVGLMVVVTATPALAQTTTAAGGNIGPFIQGCC